MSEFRRSFEAEYSEVSGMNEYMAKVFTRMGIALLLTAVTAFLGYMSLISGGFMYRIVFGSNMSFLIMTVAQFGICIYLSAALSRMEPSVASTLFYVYAIITGITFSVLPITFGYATVFTAFLFAAVMFGCCAVIGHTTKVDLTQLSGLLMGCLLALVITTVVSLFVPMLRNSLIISYAGVILFMVLVAFDIQKIKRFYYGTQGFGSFGENLATFGAFQLYLDFINIFLYVLRILGRNSNRRR